MIFEVLHGQCAVEENADAFGRVRELDCDITKLKGVDGNGGQILFCSDEHNFYLFTIQLQFVLRHPLFNVHITVMCGFQQSVDVFG